jgi:hypothetical protein
LWIHASSCIMDEYGPLQIWFLFFIENYQLEYICCNTKLSVLHLKLSRFIILSFIPDNRKLDSWDAHSWSSYNFIFNISLKSAM